MVSSTSLIVIGFIARVHQGPFDEAYFVNKATLLRQSIVAQTPGFVDTYNGVPGKYSYRSDPPLSAVYFSDSWFDFSPSTGKLELISAGGSFQSPPPGPASIGEAQASTIALTLATLLEGQEERITDVLPIESGHNTTLLYRVNVFPAHQGVPFEGLGFGTRIELEHSTGKVIMYRPADVPRCLPPSSVTPAVSMVEAEATVASHVGNIADPPPVVQLYPSNLAIFMADAYDLGPDTNFKKSWFTTADRAEFASNRGVLAYAVCMARISAYVPHLDAYGTFSTCYVNAQTGQLMVEYITTGIGGGPSGKPRFIAPFSGELEPGQMTVVVGKRSKTIADGAITPVSAPKSPLPHAKRKLVVLKRGRVFIQAEWDAKHNLLWVNGKVPKWVKPNPALIAAIKPLLDSQKM